MDIERIVKEKIMCPASIRERTKKCFKIEIPLRNKLTSEELVMVLGNFEEFKRILREHVEILLKGLPEPAIEFHSQGYMDFILSIGGNTEWRWK